MVHVKMIKSILGSENGIRVQEYKQGQEYDISDKLANVFVTQLKVAEQIEEMKSISVLPENKSFDPEGENKSPEEINEKDEEVENSDDNRNMKRKYNR